MSRARLPVEGHLRRVARRRRWLRRGTLAVGTALALLMVLILWGWRYGFTRLPKLVVEVQLPEVEMLDWDALPPDCAWGPVRELAEHSDIQTWWRQSETLRELTASAWIEEGAINRDGVLILSNWLAAKPPVEAAFDRMLAAPRPPPARGTLESADRTLRLLGWVPLARAVIACPDAGDAGQSEAALRHLITGFAFYARLTPQSDFAAIFDERGPREVDATLGRAFRGLVLHGPTLEPAVGRALLEELHRVTNGILPFEAAYALRVQRAREERDADRRDLAADVRRALSWCAFALRRDVADVGKATGSWFGSGSFELPPTFKAAGHLRRPLSALAVWAQEAVAREVDFESIWRVRLERSLAAVVKPDSPTIPTRSPEWLRWLDRPAVWNSTRHLPRPDTVLSELGEFLGTVEACRLALALRLYQNRAGDWPDSLEQLVPDLLPAVPVDALSGKPLRYRREGTGWRLTAGRTDSSPSRLEWTGSR